MGSSTRIIVAMVVVVALAGAFWTLALGPKRKQADDLSSQVSSLRYSVSQAEDEANAAAEARREFPGDYQQLVLLGKAVPSSDDTSSLLIELNRIANSSNVSFDSIALSSSATTSSSVAAPTAAPTPTTPAPTDPAAAAAAPTGVPASTTVPPTEAAAALLPIGATIGPAGLGVMPYTLNFSGNFFDIADFIKGIDSLVNTDVSNIAVDGRLVTIDGFALNGDADLGFPSLEATFSVTTYLTPPDQGATAGATATAPAPATTVAAPTDSAAGAEAAATTSTTTASAR